MPWPTPSNRKRAARCSAFTSISRNTTQRAHNPMTHYYHSASKLIHFSVPGDLLSTNAAQFRASALAMVEAHTAESREWQGVEVNLSQARMIDSAGLNALIGLLRKLKSDGRRMVIRVADAHVHRVLLFTRMDKQAEII